MSVHHHVYHIIQQHHLVEWFRLGKEILLEVITEVFKNPLENVVGTDERGYIIALIQTCLLYTSFLASNGHWNVSP